MTFPPFPRRRFALLHSLRWRIVLIAAALVAASSLVIGGVTLLAVRGYLVGQLDSGLVRSAQRVDRIGGQLYHRAPQSPSQAGVTSRTGGTTQLGTGGPAGTTQPGTTQPGTTRPPGGGEAGDFVGVPGQAAQTIVAVVDDGKVVVNGFVDSTGKRHELSATERATLERFDTATKPTSVNLGPDLGHYRVASRSVAGGATVITGVPLAAVDATVWRVAWVILGVVVLAVAAAAATGAIVIGRSLNPLRHVAATASAVTDVRLDRGDVRLGERVAPADLASTVEVGQVGGALNALLEHVADALAARQASEETMRRFVADASHELRTPLATVRAYAQLSAREHELTDDLERNISRIDRESVRMSELVEQLLLLARLDAGALVAAGAAQTSQTEVNLSLIVAEAAGDARAAASDHEWHLDLDAEPVVLHGDESQLRRLVVNLLANARTHTPPGTRVDISVHAAQGVNTLTVADDGPGVPPALQPTVFARFARGDTARNRDGDSTGLGLAIVKAIAEAHGGTVSLDSAPGRTVFTVALPPS
ncbi:sensor histidine kinase [Gryllotalpicola reticulitermitis]|uniref:histidine kinase n=1 Tax=Gryllotalpicola reticulitermitis TaxID=1184153 RepID=A0ABV8Q644_9MICO